MNRSLIHSRNLNPTAVWSQITPFNLPSAQIQSWTPSGIQHPDTHLCRWGPPWWWPACIYHSSWPSWMASAWRCVCGRPPARRAVGRRGRKRDQERVVWVDASRSTANRNTSSIQWYIHLAAHGSLISVMGFDSIWFQLTGSPASLLYFVFFYSHLSYNVTNTIRRYSQKKKSYFKAWCLDFIHSWWTFFCYLLTFYRIMMNWLMFQHMHNH